MASSVATLAVSVTARTQKFASGMKRARKATRNFQVDVTHLSRAVKAMGLGALVSPFTAIAAGATAAAAGFVTTLRSIEKFNRALRNSLAIMGDVSTTMRGEMRRAAIDVARTTQFSATDAAKAYFFLASAGLDAATSIKAMPVVAKFAQAGMFDLARATDLLTDAQSALGLTTGDATVDLENMRRVSDVLVKANTLANASVEQFSTSLTTKAGTAIKTWNLSIEQGVALLSLFADKGLKGAEAGTALAIVLRDLSTKAIKNAAAFRDMGITVFDATGRMREPAAIINDLEDALEGMGDEMKKTTLMTLGFTDKSVGFTQMLIGMSEKVRSLTSALEDAGGTTALVASKQLTPLQKGLELLSAEWVAATQSGSLFTDVMGQALTSLAVGLRGMSAAAGDLKDNLLLLFLGARRAESNIAIDPEMDAGARLDAIRKARDERTKAIADSVAAGTAMQHAAAMVEAEDLEALKKATKLLDTMKRDFVDLGAGPMELVVRKLQGMELPDHFMQEVREVFEAFESREAQDSIDNFINALERQQGALTMTARELDVVEARWMGATQAELDYVNALHDGIDAAREQMTLERQREADARRFESRVNRITEFKQVSATRSAISGVTGGRRKQSVRDEQVALLLKEQNRLIQNQSNVAVMSN